MTIYLQTIISDLTQFQVRLSHNAVTPSEAEQKLNYLENEVSMVFRGAQQILHSHLQNASEDSELESALVVAKEVYESVRLGCLTELINQLDRTVNSLFQSKIPVEQREFTPARKKISALSRHSLSSSQKERLQKLAAMIEQGVKFHENLLPAQLPEKRPRVLISETVCGLPLETWHHIFSNCIKGTHIRGINRQFCRVYNDFLMTCWGQLKKNPPQGTIDIAAEMAEIEELFPPNGFIWFCALKERCANAHGAHLPPGQIPAFFHLAAEVQRLAGGYYYNRGLMVIWGRLNHVHPSTPEQVRVWLNSPISAFVLNLITELDLSQRNLKVLPSQEMGLFINLQKLILAENRLAIVPQEITALTQLRELDLRQNQFACLPTQIGALVSLREFYLYDNRLTALPEEISSLTNLDTLGCSNNKLASLPQGYVRLTNLVSLKLDGNAFELLPDKLTELTALESMELQNNKLRALPEGIGALRNLEYLWLQQNQLKRLPDGITLLTHLKDSFNVSHNQLESLPAGFWALENVVEVDLSHNLLRAIHTEAFTRVVELNLSHNELETLPEEMGTLTNLKKLDLRNNPLRFIPSSISALPHLDEFYLDPQKQPMPSFEVNES